MILPRFSASKIQRYAGCKSDYISRYLLGMKPEVETTWGIFGTACHSAIQAGYEGTGFPYDVAQSVVEKRFAELDTIPYIGYTPSKILEKTFAVLDNFDYDLFSPAQMELEFILPFTDFVTRQVICELHGFIDMVTTDGRVIDFKTNSKAPPQKDVNKSIQLALYRWAYGEIYGEYPKQVAIYHLPTNKLIVAEEEVLDTTLGTILILIREMLELTADTELTSCTSCNPFCALKNWGQ